MHPAEQRAKQMAHTGARDFAYQTTGAALRAAYGSPSDLSSSVKNCEVSALEKIAQRLHGLASRLDDTNRNTLAFLERVTGEEPTGPEPSPMNKVGDSKLPAMDALEYLVSRVEYHEANAAAMSYKLARIG